MAAFKKEPNMHKFLLCALFLAASAAPSAQTTSAVRRT
jgi:hypothetical protein